MSALEKYVYPSIDELAARLNGAPLAKAPSTLLYGPAGGIDSINLVTLIVLVEEKIRNSTGKPVRLVSDKAMSMRESPFQTLESFGRYIDGLIGDASRE